MSSLGSNNPIAASVAQSAHHQGQVAKAQDAARNQATRQAAALKKAREKQLESVDEVDVTSDEHVRVEEHRPLDDRKPSAHAQNAGSRREEDEGDQPHVDITA